MKLFGRALPAAVATLVLAACCHSDTETGTGEFLCETCPGSINLVCTKNAESLAQQDATAKAKVRCGANKLTAGGFDLNGPAMCVRRGNNWMVQVNITQKFTCCT